MGNYTHPDQSPPDLTPAEIAAQSELYQQAIPPVNSRSTLSNHIKDLVHLMKSWPGVIDDIIGGLIASVIFKYVTGETPYVLFAIALALFVVWFITRFPKGFLKFAAWTCATYGIISAVFQRLTASYHDHILFIITILAAGALLYFLSRRPFMLGHAGWHISLVPIFLSAFISAGFILPVLLTRDAQPLEFPTGEQLRPHDEDSRPVPPTVTASPTLLPTHTSTNTAAPTRLPTLPSPTATAEPRCPRLNVPLCTDCTITILDGDKLSCLAVRARVSIDLIVVFNPQITNPDLIFAGDSLYIPDPSVQIVY